MRINVNKFVCMRFGQCFSTECANLITDSGDELKWAEECRYLGVYLVSARQFKWSWHNGKCAFYRAVNIIFGRQCRSASSEVVLHLVLSKCIHVLLYGLDAVQSMLLISSRCSIRSLIFLWKCLPLSLLRLSQNVNKRFDFSQIAIKLIVWKSNS